MGHERAHRARTGRDPARELDALFPDTSALRERIFAALRQLRRQKQRRTWRKLKPLLIAVAVAASVLFATLMVNASMRATVINTIIDWTNRDIGISFEIGGEPRSVLPTDLEPHYIPDGLIRNEEFCSRNASMFFYAYDSEDGSVALNIQVNLSENGSITRMDNEHTDYEKITFQGVPAYLGYSEEDDIYIMLWAKDGLEYFIYGNISLSDVLMIANNIY